MLSHLVGRDATTGISTQQIRTARLDFADLDQVIARCTGHIGMRLHIANQPPRLNAEHPTFRVKGQRKVAQVQHVAKHARNHKERRRICLRTLVQRHQIIEPFYRRSGGRRAVAIDNAGFGSDQGGTFCNCGRFEQDRDRELDLERAFDVRKQAHGDQRMATQIEKTILDTNRADAQQGLPHLGELFFDAVTWCDVSAVKVRALKALALCNSFL